MLISVGSVFVSIYTYAWLIAPHWPYLIGSQLGLSPQMFYVLRGSGEMYDMLVFVQKNTSLLVRK